MNGIMTLGAGVCLAAMPGMTDPRFHQTVVYVCSHEPKGSMGLVINRPSPNATFQSIVGQLGIVVNDPMRASLPVLAGGPVEPIRGFLLHDPSFAETDTVVIDPECASISNTVEALKAIAQKLPGEAPPFLFALGYSGWEAGQLDREIQDNAWLAVPVCRALLYDVPYDQRWDYALARVGLRNDCLSTLSGRA